MEAVIISAISIIAALIAGSVSGIISSIGTVRALNVHIDYLKEQAKKHDEEIKDLHLKVHDHVKTYHRSYP